MHYKIAIVSKLNWINDGNNNIPINNDNNINNDHNKNYVHNDQW